MWGIIAIIHEPEGTLIPSGSILRQCVCTLGVHSLRQSPACFVISSHTVARGDAKSANPRGNCLRIPRIYSRRYALVEENLTVAGTGRTKFTTTAGAYRHSGPSSLLLSCRALKCFSKIPPSPISLSTLRSGPGTIGLLRAAEARIQRTHIGHSISSASRVLRRTRIYRASHRKWARLQYCTARAAALIRLAI